MTKMRARQMQRLRERRSLHREGCSRLESAKETSCRRLVGWAVPKGSSRCLFVVAGDVDVLELENCCVLE